MNFQAGLKEENEKFGDLLRLSIEDKYDHLAYKTLSSFAWLWNNFKDSELDWIIKMDDDLDVKLDKVIRQLSQIRHKKEASSDVHCHAIMRGMPPERNQNGVNRKLYTNVKFTNFFRV